MSIRSFVVVSACAAFAATTVAFAQVTDTDFDGVPDAFDNCVLVPNGPLAGEGPPQYDVDQDGYGNACDCDFKNDGAVGLGDEAVHGGSFSWVGAG